MRLLGLFATLLLIIACFFPWVYIESANIIVSGVDARGTSYGKPGYFHFFMATLYLVCHFTPRIWAKRLNLLVSALNVAWAVRNYFIISACSGGECPEKKIALYIVLISSLLMLVAALFPKIELKKSNDIHTLIS